MGPTPLPEFAVDEVIPRFRLLDAAGAPREPREPGEPGEWLIPGVLRRAAPRAAATPASAPPPLPEPGQRRAPDDIPPPAAETAGPTGVPTGGRTPAGSGFAEVVDPATPKPGRPAPRQSAFAPPEGYQAQPGATAASTVAPGGFAKLLPAGFDAGAALDAELERAIAVAMELKRRQAVHQLLAAVAVRATHEPPAAAQPMLSWIAAIRFRLDQDDPVDRLIRAINPPR